MGPSIAARVGVAICKCGLEVVEDVDRVQPHYIKKSNLEGEWFYRQTMVDRPPQYIYMFTGIEGALEKIRWEVREISSSHTESTKRSGALRTTRISKGPSSRGLLSPYSRSGHTDIIRDFNLNSGQQSNVSVENARRDLGTSGTICVLIDVQHPIGRCRPRWFPFNLLVVEDACLPPRDTEPYNPGPKVDRRRPRLLHQLLHRQRR